MSRSESKKRERERQKVAEKRNRRKKRLWKYGVVSSLLFGLTLIPYAIDLFNRPSIWNGFLLIGLSATFFVAVMYLVRQSK